MTRKKILTLLLLLLTVYVAGCRVRTIYVAPGTPVRIAKTLKGVEVWVFDKDGNAVASKMDIPEGWYALSDTGAGK